MTGHSGSPEQIDTQLRPHSRPGDVSHIRVDCAESCFITSSDCQHHKDKNVKPAYLKKSTGQFWSVTGQSRDVRQSHCPNRKLVNMLPLLPRLTVLFVTITAINATCPFPDWVTYQGKCYHAEEFTLPWDTVANVCDLAFPGSQPVSIHDLVQNSFLYENVADGLHSYWLGLHRADTNELWTWTDGSPFNFSKWAADQPEGDGERCGHFWYEHEGDWGARDCASDRAYFMCQIDEEP